MTDVDDEIKRLRDGQSEASRDRHNLRTELGQRITILEMETRAIKDEQALLRTDMKDLKEMIFALNTKLDRIGTIWGTITFIATGIMGISAIAANLFKGH